MSLNTVVGIVAAFKAGEIAESTARRLLREFGTGDSTIDGLLAVGVGVATGFIVGDIVSDAVNDLFDLF
jgi:hypothetical protein